MNGKITAVILTKNEEKNILRCLKAVKFSDEVVIVDDYSVDKTLKKIRSSKIEIGIKSKIIISKRKLNDNFAEQRNFGIEKASGEWILFVDPDEEVTDELRKEIPKRLQNDKDLYAAYHVRRRDFWWGRELRYGETEKLRNLGIIRLVKKGSGKWLGKVHEEFKADGRVGRLNSFINHYPHPTVKEFLKEINFYSTLRARELRDKGEPANLWKIIFFPLSKFIINYFIKLGFLDGPSGFGYAFLMSFHSFLVRAKLFQFNMKHET